MTSDLITRLEQAEAGSFDLDMAVADAAKATDRSWSSWPYTTSLDAIVALLGEKLPGWNVTIRIPSNPKHRHVCEIGAPDNPDAIITDPWPFRTSAGGSNAPLACAAALLRAIKEGEHG